MFSSVRYYVKKVFLSFMWAMPTHTKMAWKLRKGLSLSTDFQDEFLGEVVAQKRTLGALRDRNALSKP